MMGGKLSDRLSRPADSQDSGAVSASPDSPLSAGPDNQWSGRHASFFPSPSGRPPSGSDCFSQTDLLVTMRTAGREPDRSPDVPPLSSLLTGSAPGVPLADDRTQILRVKEANDIVDVVGGYVTLRPAAGTYKGLCPFHDDQRPSFDVDPRRQRYRCWSCGKYGDVLQFVLEFNRVDFREALEILARRAGITLENGAASAQQKARASMLEIMAWASEQYHECLVDDDLAQDARRYVGERQILGETVRRFGLGYAPLAGDWLVRRAAKARKDFELLQQVGLVGRRQEGEGYYDRFRDRVMFPIRDTLGKTVGFGGRILPSSPLSARAPKYYNSSDTPLFSKSQNLYGIDQARHAAAKAGFLAVVEGYTDVLMAHQKGIANVVATMGTALNERHVRQLRRVGVGRVVLVFDADAGGQTGVDRALTIFASQDVDLAIATLPAGMDPCDLLVARGPEPFRQALAAATDALEFKLTQALAGETAQGVEGQRRAVDAVLGILALAPALPGKDGAVKLELMVTRIARRLGIQETTVWARLHELREQRRRQEARADEPPAAPPARQALPAAPHEKELVSVLLAEPALVAEAKKHIRAEEVQHPGLRLLLEGLYRLHAEGQTPDLDLLRPRIENPLLAAKALELQEIGRENLDRPKWLATLVARFAERRGQPAKQEIHNQLNAASDPEAARELLRRLQERNKISGH